MSFRLSVSVCLSLFLSVPFSLSLSHGDGLWECTFFLSLTIYKAVSKIYYLSCLKKNTQTNSIFQSYREFHSELYPDTASGEPAVTASEWFSGQDALAPRVAMSPDKPLIKHGRRGALFDIGSNGARDDRQTKKEEAAPAAAEVVTKVLFVLWLRCVISYFALI